MGMESFNPESKVEKKPEIDISEQSKMEGAETEAKNTGDKEKKEILPKSTKAIAAMGAALLWGYWKEVSGMSQGYSKEDKEKVEKQGIWRTMKEKADKVYKTIGNVESGNWDELFGKDPEKKETKEGK